MKRIIPILVSLVFLLCSCTSSNVTTTTQTSGKRIVAGTVSAAQYLNTLDADLVGVPTTDKNLPEKYKNVPQIGLPMTPNFELVLASEADIFVADVTMRATLEEMFYEKPTELILLDNNSYASIENNINLLAEKLGVQEKAKAVIDGIQKKKEEAIKMAQGKPRPKVAIIFGTAAAFMLATGESFTGDILRMLGAENITDNLGIDGAYVNFDREKLAELNPDVILRLSHADPKDTAKAFDEEFKKPFWQGIKAVQTKRVYDLDIKYFGVTANFDSVDAPMKLAEILYKED